MQNRIPNRILIENLEARQLLAGTAVLNAGPNTLYFNAVAPDNASSTYNLRINNSGTGRLLLTDTAFRVRGDDAANFKVLNFPSTGRSIGPGGTINVTVQFTAKSGQSRDIKTAMLRIESNDPKHKIRFIPLRGLPTNGEGGSLEPSLQKVFNLFDLGIQTGQANIESYLYSPGAASEEVPVNTLVKAGEGNVTITPLALFTNHATPAVRMGYYTPGELDSDKYLWYVPTESSQSVNPFYYGKNGFDPGSAEFGLVTQYPFFNNPDNSVRKVYSEKSLNATWDPNTSYTHMRFFPYKDAKGKVVANTYIVAEEEYTTAYDNQDLIYVVTNVKPADATPTLSTENLVGFPDNETLSFNKVQTPDPDVGNTTRLSNTLRVRNSGTAPLIISTGLAGGDAGDFSITSGAAANTSIAPGAFRDIKINFNATAGMRAHAATLTITSNDAAHPSTSVSLLGYWQQYSEKVPGPGGATNEPTAQQIINNLLGYTTVIPNGSQINNGGNIQTKGDEVNAQFFTAADTGAYVRVVDLANFHGETYLDANGDPQATSSFMQWYNKGSKSSAESSGHRILQDKTLEGQMILPLDKTTNNVASGHFDPGTATFGFAVEANLSKDAGEYSGYADNRGSNGTNGQYLRFFPVYDKNGVVVPNAYFMLHDYNTATTNYDFNDNVYLITNIVPEGEVKTPATATAFRTGSNEHRLIFSSPTDGPRITGFNVYRSDTPRGVYALLTATPLDARSGTVYTDGTANPANVYYYAITSVGQNGDESRQVVVSI